MGYANHLELSISNSMIIYWTPNQFQCCIINFNVYAKTIQQGFVIFVVDVDDIIIASNNLSIITDIENTLAQTFEMTLLGNIHFLLGN
jgi:hypothetical protein